MHGYARKNIYTKREFFNALLMNVAECGHEVYFKKPEITFANGCRFFF